MPFDVPEIGYDKRRLFKKNRAPRKRVLQFTLSGTNGHAPNAFGKFLNAAADLVTQDARRVLI